MKFSMYDLNEEIEEDSDPEIKKKKKQVKMLDDFGKMYGDKLYGITNEI